jgi:SAM-dependent methyltransferase
MENKSAVHKLDLPETSLRHREIILQKPFLKQLYQEWYGGFARYRQQLTPGRTLEIGSGGGFAKEVIPDIITSDILPLSVCDYCFPAERIPFDNNSLQSIFMLNVLHHIPAVRDFFREVDRVLIPGGALYMIEPANTPFSSFIYRNFHHEPFVPDVKEWHFQSTGPLSDSNQALPWIIFERDYLQFTREFPSLKKESIQYHTPFRYLISGGLSKPQLLPDFTFTWLRALENKLGGANRYLGLFQTIIIRKT